MKLKWGFRIWLLVVFLVLSLLSIFITPNFLQKGVLITSVNVNSSAFDQGLRQGQLIVKIDNKQISSLEDFTKALQDKYPSNKSVKTILTTLDSEIILFSKEAPQVTVSEVPKTNI